MIRAEGPAIPPGQARHADDGRGDHHPAPPSFRPCSGLSSTTGSFMVVLLSLLWMGGIGFVDDYLKIVQGKSRGLVAKWKLVGQVRLRIRAGTHAAATTRWCRPTTMPASATTVPFFKFVIVGCSRPWLYVLFVTTVITGSSNAVNLTDGLDGLATGLSAIAAAAFALVRLHLRPDRHDRLPQPLLSARRRRAHRSSAPRCFGGCLGFLWFNAHPAQVFMGDTGSLAHRRRLRHGRDSAQGGVPAADHRRRVRRGGGVGACCRPAIYKWFKRTRGKEYADAHQVFRMAPLHHHFEKLGWAETDGGDPLLHPRHLLRDGRAGDAQAAMSFDGLARHGPRGGGHRVWAGAGSRRRSLLRREGIPVYASDRSPAPDPRGRRRGNRATRGRPGPTVQLGGHDLARIAPSRAVRRFARSAARRAAAPRRPRRRGAGRSPSSTSGYAALPEAKFAAITGTNGKTTTTALTGHLLVDGGAPCRRRGQHRAPARRGRAGAGALPSGSHWSCRRFSCTTPTISSPTIGATDQPRSRSSRPLSPRSRTTTPTRTGSSACHARAPAG